MEQRDKEWHELRKTKIGASDASSVLGVSKWKTAYELWEEKMGNGIKQPFTNVYMQRGIDLEPEALRAFENITGYLMSPEVLISPLNEFMMCSLDGLEIDSKAAVEIKAPGKKDHECALDGQVPEKYIPQLQHQISVTGLEMIYYFSYNPDHAQSNKILQVYRDQDYIDKMIEKEAHFYYEHMLKKIPPSNDHQIKTIESQQWKLLTDEYKKLDYQTRESEKRKDEIKDLLLQISELQSAQGNGIILQKIERKGIIDYKNIPVLKGLRLEEYRKPSSSYWQVKESNDGLD